MTLDASALESLLCERLSEEVRLVKRPDGALMLRTGFEFPDGDRFPIQVEPVASGGVRLTDRGHTIMHLSHDHDMDAFLKGTRGALLEQIAGESGIDREGGVFCLDTSVGQLPDAIFRFGQALTRIHDLGFLSRSSARSTFYEDLADLLKRLIPAEKIQSDYAPEEVPNPAAYPVDYRIEGKEGRPLFLYGIANRDKARLATIMLSHFHLHGLRFDSLLVFQDQKEIPRLDLERLSNVGGEMIGSLEATEHLERKLLQRVA